MIFEANDTVLLLGIPLRIISVNAPAAKAFSMALAQDMSRIPQRF